MFKWIVKAAKAAAKWVAAHPDEAATLAELAKKAAKRKKEVKDGQ